MMSASSFSHYSRQTQAQVQTQLSCNSQSRIQQPSPLSNITNANSTCSTPTVSASSSLPKRPSYSNKPRIALFNSPIQDPSESEPSPTTPVYIYPSPPSSIYSPQRCPPSASLTGSSSTTSSRPSMPFSKWWKAKYEHSQTPEPFPSTTLSIQQQEQKQKQQQPQPLSDKMSVLSEISPVDQPTLIMRSTSHPLSTTGPVQIPTKSHITHNKHTQSLDKHVDKHVKRQSSTRSTNSQRPPRRSRPQDVHLPNAIPESVMSLLAMTDIPKPRGACSQRKTIEKELALTVDCFMDRVTDTELSFNLGKSPLDMLLLPPDELDCELESPVSVSDSDMESALGPRTVSMESMPSLADSFAYGTPSSVDSSWGGYSHASHSVSGSRSRKPKQRPTRASLEPVSSPPGQPDTHPLSHAVTVDQLDFRVFDEPCNEVPKEEVVSPFPFHVKSAFKSNLTASLRAIKNAARSISGINFSSIPPDDFLTRSILTIDPRVPFTDERRPPPLAEEPSAALRRYLNPMSSARLEPRPVTQGPIRTFTASIQMQTYKVSKSRVGAKPAALPSIQQPAPCATSSSHQPQPQSPSQTAFSYPPGAMRQREMRENPDFIRIAVLEMAMRRSGKLDETVPGRARWALAPRKPTRVCEVSIDGVPERWVPRVIV